MDSRLRGNDKVKTWSLLPTISAPMGFQLALDEVLFDRYKNVGARLPAGQAGSPCPGSEGGETPPLLRFYFASEPCVTVGYSMRNRRGALSLRGHEVPEAISDSRLRSLSRAREIASAAFGVLAMTGEGSPSGPPRNDNTTALRRITGGGRVVHGQDLIFSLVASKDDDESFCSVRMSYLKIHEAIKTGLEGLGLKPRFYRCDENLPRRRGGFKTRPYNGEDCFRFPIATDLALGRQKIAGGGQKRSAGHLLHEESIMPVRGIEMDDLIAAIKEGFEKIFLVVLQPSDLDPSLLRHCEEAEGRRSNLAAKQIASPLRGSQ